MSKRSENRSAPVCRRKPVFARWLGAFRGGPSSAEGWAAALRWEFLAERERAAEVLWRGQSPLCDRTSGIGLGYNQDACRMLYLDDCWSEPAADGRLRAGDPTWLGYRGGEISSALRWWNGERRLHHGEAFLRIGARPCAVLISRHVRRDGLRWRVAHEFAAAAGLPIVHIRPLDGPVAADGARLAKEYRKKRLAKRRREIDLPFDLTEVEPEQADA